MNREWFEKLRHSTLHRNYTSFCLQMGQFSNFRLQQLVFCLPSSFRLFVFNKQKTSTLAKHTQDDLWLLVFIVSVAEPQRLWSHLLWTAAFGLYFFVIFTCGSGKNHTYCSLEFCVYTWSSTSPRQPVLDVCLYGRLSDDVMEITHLI